MDEYDRSVLDVPVLSEFRERIGETASLHALVVVESVRVEWVTLASWWPDFLELRQTAEEAQRGLQRTKAREQWERVAQSLRDRLPHDDAFITLACEARPRITALRIRAEEVVADVGKATGGLPDRTIREVAAAIKSERKQGKMRQ